MGHQVIRNGWPTKFAHRGVRRGVAYNPASLDSPLRYSVEVIDDENDSAYSDMPPARPKLLEAAAVDSSDGRPGQTPGGNPFSPSASGGMGLEACRT
jgi:hypothetical protein